MFFFVLFFFCKQKTAYEMRISDWSSDVCSSDLPPVSDLFGARLVEEGVIDGDFVAQHRDEFIAHLEEEFKLGANYKANKADWFAGRWTGLYAPKDEAGARQIGRASCRERVCKDVLISVVAVTLKKKE